MSAKPKKAKYDRKYCRQLDRGMRKNGMSIAEVCKHWGIVVPTYYNWIEAYPEFRRAAEAGERDTAAWWMETFRKAATGEIKGNAALLVFAVKNMKIIGWTDKTEVIHQDEKIQKITINVLAPSESKTIKVIPKEIPEEGEFIEG